MTREHVDPETGARRVLPTLLGLLLAVAIACAALPALRHQVTRSFVRDEQHYLELYFADEATARDCPVVGGALQVLVVVGSHLAREQTLAWTASGGGAQTGGRVMTRPGRESRFTVRLTPFTSPTTTTVRLTGRTERLTLHCR